MLPEPVMARAQKEFLNYNGLGMSVIEMSHRSKEYQALADEAVQDLRDILRLPDNYQVLFMHGGGRGMFANVPMNLASKDGSADYVHTGAWSGYALKEARKYTKVNALELECVNDKGQHSLNMDALNLDPAASYVHYCMNETIHGIEIFEPLDTGSVPLIADASSTILSRPLDVTKYGIIYAGAQKNIGPSGFCVVIIRDDLIKEPAPFTPDVSSFQITRDKGSMFNTPNTFAWYLSGLVFKWIKDEIGGLEAMEQRNKEKAALLYDCIDSSDGYYVNKVDPQYRSRMNVVFNLRDESLGDAFLKEAKEAGLSGLKGHRVLGGMRASLYNAMPLEGVKALTDFMAAFKSRH